MKVILAGGSGFLGRSLASFLTVRGHSCTVLTRHPQESGDLSWDGRTAGDWVSALEGAGAVVNLTGRSVNCLPNEANRKEILGSRLDSVRVLHEAIGKCQTPPAVLVQASSLAIYGDTTRDCGEDAPHGDDFPAQVCEAWEKELFRTNLPRTRKCALRIGFVLGPNGGALGPLRKITRCFLGGTVGGGGQYISWLHIEDLNRMILACIEDASMTGIYNATSPNPVTNREFMKALRMALHRPWSPPVPSLLVRFGARWVLRTDGKLALTGRKCLPSRLLGHGFTFDHTDLDRTLAGVMSQWA